MHKKIAALVLLAGFIVASAEDTFPTITPYGFVQYRLRLRDYTAIPDTGSVAGSLDYYNQIAYYLGVSAKVNNEVTMQLQIGNDWAGSDTVIYTGINTSASRKPSLYPYFSLAYAKWDPGYMNISAGILPLVSDGSLDLIERSLTNAGANAYSYIGAANASWTDNTNNCIQGLKIGAPVLKGDFKLEISGLTSIIDQRIQTLAVNSNANPPAVLGILEVPMSKAALTVIPQFVVIANRIYNSTLEKGDHEIGAGLNGIYVFNPMILANLCFGYASLSNDHSHNPGDTVYENDGIILKAGTTVNAGPGKVIGEVRYSTNENQKVANSFSQYVFADCKYSWDINKNFSIMPRLRLFSTVYADNDSKNNFKYELRPELIFTGKF